MRISVAIIGCVVFLAGCELVPPYEPVDFGKTPDGKSYIRDTPRSWDYMRIGLQQNIDDELHKRHPSGGSTNWNAFWVDVFKTWRDSGGLENPEKYVTYIVQRRRELGLPEIVFPPNKR
jgi:hypothetical protein